MSKLIILKMDSFELNKIIAAILMVALLVIGLGKIADVAFHVKKPKNPGYIVEGQVQLASSTPEASEVEEKIDIVALMAQGDVTDGEKIFKKCAACHSINKGGPNKIGPALYNVIGRKVGSMEGYKYSKTLASYGKEWMVWCVWCGVWCGVGCVVCGVCSGSDDAFDV